MAAGPSDEFVLAMTQCQDRLYAYIRTLIPQSDPARDVLQETNVVMLRKADELAPGQSFEAWACKIAYYKVLAYVRDRARDRHLFDAELVEKLNPHAQRSADPADRMAALEDCIDLLEPKHRDLISERYKEGLSVKEIAQRMHASARTVASRMFRLRELLSDCVERRVRARANH